MSKQEVKEAVAEDFDSYMTKAHFNVQSVKDSITSSKETGVSKGDETQNVFEKAHREFKQAKDYGMNSVFNFYREGVMSNYIKRL